MDANATRERTDDRMEIGVVAVAPRGRQVRPLRRLGLFVIVALTAGTIGWIAADRLRSPADLAAERAVPEPSPILAEVERRALTATVVARGSIQFAETRPVALAGPVGDSSITQQIATQLPSVGDVIENGSVLAEISGRPVIALEGATPRYRSTVRNAAGPDIRQLEGALSAAGFDPGSADETFTWSDQEAISDLYEALGYAPLKDSTGIWVPAGEIVFFPTLPLQVADVQLVLGQEATGPLLSAASSIVEILGQLNRADAALVDLDSVVEVTIPELGFSTEAIVKEIGSSLNDSPDPLQVGITALPLHPAAIADLIGTSVRMEIPVGSTRTESLVVPVTAVNQHSDGRVTVIVVDQGGNKSEFEVELGFAAQGYVEIENPHIKAGNSVLVGFEVPPLGGP